MIDFSKNNADKKPSMKGIIDYEIAKKLNKNYLIVPIYYANTGFGIFDALGLTGNDYFEIANQIVNNTKEYIDKTDNIKNVKVEKIQREENNPIITIYGYRSEDAFKIIFK